MRTFILPLVTVLLFWTPVSAAEEDSALAKRHFAEATKAFNLGEFSRAIEEYRLAYNSKPEPSLLYNIAQAYRLSGNLRQALFFYRSYLHNLPDADNRSEVVERIAAIDDQLKTEKAVADQPPNTPVPVSPAPASTALVERAALPPAQVVDVKPLAPRPHPIAQRWWLWTAVGVAVVGVALGVGLGVGLSDRGTAAPSSGLGTAMVFY